MKRLTNEEMEAIDRHLDEWGDAQIGGHDYASHMLADLHRYKTALEAIREAYYAEASWVKIATMMDDLAKKALANDCPTCGEPLRKMQQGLPYCQECEIQLDEEIPA